MPPPVPGGSADPTAALINNCKHWVAIISDRNFVDENKLHAIQEISRNLECIMTLEQYPFFLELIMKVFIKFLLDGEPHFIAEYKMQQIRKSMLDVIYRLPTNKYLKPYAELILNMAFKLVKYENEQNIQVCLRIIREIHKHFRPPITPQIPDFLHFVKSMFGEIPNNINKIFEPRAPLIVKDLSEINIELLLTEIFTNTPIKKISDGTGEEVTYNLIPRGTQSLKVIQDLPLIVVLMCELYKENVHQEMTDYIPIFIKILTLQPTKMQRLNPHFNKEIYIDFMAVQVKSLSFLAYIIKIYQEAVGKHSQQMVDATMSLLKHCPPEVTPLRKDLLIATRHILATDMRLLFVPHMEQLFDDNILLGTGWTSLESLRPFAYSTLADLVHQVKHELPMSDLIKAVHAYAKNIHDETLPTSIQTISCKLLLNLVDCIKQQSDRDPSLMETAQDLLIRMIEVFVIKFKIIAKLHIPVLIAKSKQLEAQAKPPVVNTPVTKKEESESIAPPAPNKIEEKEVPKSRFGFPQSQASSYSLLDCRTLVKTLVCGVKTITWKFKTLINERETEVFIRLVKYALVALDIYTLSLNAPNNPLQRPASQQPVRTKEEKEVLEHFSGIFSVLEPQTFREIFTETIDYVVDRIFNNLALQIVGNSFLSNCSTSPIFATVLVEYLLGRMEEMGNGNMERSNLYLKLFKLVFGSVSLFAAENEHMLKPHLHQIVNRSMELAMTAKEPYNYFLLLRTLFRSIGGGNHDLLYQEFLPLLPNLLQGLNSLQSGLHKQHMKDLFVELCLTVPVRLSSLLPYLPMLMDPLVSALNGSPTLVSQGLRTLELCVDNLQPDFLYEHIQPVRAELMQALWRSLRSSQDPVAHVAFRVLGKFGGGNRKMMVEPQKLEYVTQDTPGSNVLVGFPEHPKFIHFPVEKAISTAVALLKPNPIDVFYRRQAWEVVKTYIFASLEESFSYAEIDKANMVEKLFSHPSYKNDNIPQFSAYFFCQDKAARQTLVDALTGMFFGSIIKDLADEIQMMSQIFVKQFTLVAISQQAGPLYLKEGIPKGWMDPYVLIDAIGVVLSHEEKELFKCARTALLTILQTAQTVIGSKDRACRLIYCKYVAECMSSLCYDRAWYTKLGGCLAIMALYETMSIRWLYQNLFVFVKAQLFVMMDLTGEVSSGAINQAKMNLEALIRKCAPLLDPESDLELFTIQNTALTEVTKELIRQITSPTDLLREQAMYLLGVFAECQGKTVSQVMEPHKAMFPPKKHLLRHQAANAQIGLMEGNTFYTSLDPLLFSLELSSADAENFFREVIALCDAPDQTLQKYPCYKSLGSLIPIRKAALRALAACHYLPQMTNKIFKALYQSLERPNPELQEAGFQALKTFISSTHLDIGMVVETMKPLLDTLSDYRKINLCSARRLSYLVQLFPHCFNEKLCDQLLHHIRKLVENLIQNPSLNSENEKVVVTLISIFPEIPAASADFIQPLTQLVLETERNLSIQASSPFRKPLIKFLLRFPQQTVTLFLSDNNIKVDMWSKYLEHLIKQEEGRPFRDVLQSPALVDRLITLAMVPTTSATLDLGYFMTPEECLEVRYQSMRIVSLLVKYDDQWISTQHKLATSFCQIWNSDKFLSRHRDLDKVEYKHWKEPKLLVKILLNYFSYHPTKIELLFNLLKVFCDKFLPDFQFFRNFLETTVAQSYTVQWKRTAFFKFVEVFHSKAIAQELKAKIIQLVIIPCFAVSFERGEHNKLIGGPPAPFEDSHDNIISVFINNVIDIEDPFAQGDSVRILVLQLSCLFVEQCMLHIHDITVKEQRMKLKRLMTFAWPFLHSNSCVDPATRYHGHLLLAHIISKFAIPKEAFSKTVLEVFNSLLRAHAIEVRTVVRQALEILTPVLPYRVEDGYSKLIQATKKILIEEGHSMQQLFHILQLIVRHFTVFYPMRHHLIGQMVNSLQRLGFSASSTIEHRKLALELAEVIIRWEAQRIKDESHLEAEVSCDFHQKRPGDDSQLPLAKRGSGISYKYDPDERKPIDKFSAEVVLNFLAKLACQVNEAAAATSTGLASPVEMLSRKCFTLIRMILKPDIWPKQCVDLHLQWMDKIFASLETNSPTLGNICISLELLTFLISVMKKEQILATLKPLQKGLSFCISSTNTKIIRLTHMLLTRLMTVFPTEPCTSNVSSKQEELECIYSSVGRVVYEGLANYEKNVNANSTSLFGTVMMLKAACASNPGYVDRLINPFIRVIHRMSREHLTAKTNEQSPGSVELLILSLDLVKNRVAVMTGETKKTFIGSILVGLIEKSQEIKIIKAIVMMVEEWMKPSKTIPGSVQMNNCGPSLREKSLLLVKLMQVVEKRFPDLSTQFLELVNYIYREDAFKNTELIPKLEPAFLAGLRCNQPQIRAKFFEVFDNSIRRRLHERLMYIVSSQNWEPMGNHYWIKQCIELILVSAEQGNLLQLTSDTPFVPGVTSLINMPESPEREDFLIYASIKQEQMETDLNYDVKQAQDGVVPLKQLISEHKMFLEERKKIRTIDFLNAVIQLCHTDTSLAEKIWIDIFPRIWSILSDRQRNALSGELLPFLVSGIHVTQKDIHPSSVSTIFEALSKCNPPIPVKPIVMSYLGKAHNLWHRVTLTLERLVAEQGVKQQTRPRDMALDCYDFEPDLNSNLQPQPIAMEHLAMMYSQLKEEDMWVGLWSKHSKYKETSVALAYEQQGFFDKALGAYELVLGKGRQDYANSPASLTLLAEEKLWEKQWIRCSKELNQWDHLLDYTKVKGNMNPYLVLESAWRLSDWNLMKEAIATVETSCPKELAWKVHLYRGYLAICHPDEQDLSIVERYVELASTLCLKEWRRLPRLVSHVHLSLLQAAQQIVELHEACQIHQGLTNEQQNSLHDMKAIVKTWRNRLPIVSDDLSHWSDVFTWRQHHYQFISDHYDLQQQHHHGQQTTTNNSMFGVHASAQALIHFGKIARKHNLTGVCLDSLSRIYTIPTVPIGDCFHKIRQQVKCYLQMASQSGNKELQEGLEVIESTNLKYFNKEVTAEFYALKGMLLAQIGRSEDANKAFSAAVQQHDLLVKAWALWGDYIEDQFTKSSPPDIQAGVCAITCFLHACRHQNESKSRKYLAKVLWLLTYNDETNALTSAVDKYVVGVPPVQWLPWIPQLLTCLIRMESKLMFNLLSQIGRMFPQAVHFPIRTLFLTLKIEQRERERERFKTAELAAGLAGKPVPPGVRPEQPQHQPGGVPDGSGGTLKVTPPMWRCSKIMRMQREIHPTILSSLEGLADQLVLFRENWHEEVLRQLRQGLAKCYVLAFENRGTVTEATITPHTLHFVKKLVSTFGLGIENPSGSNIASTVNQNGSSSLSDFLAKRFEVTLQDPIFQQMKGQFTADFNFSVPGAMKLQNLIQKLKKWITILEAKTKLLPKSFLIEEKCRFLSNFNWQTAEIGLPGEFLLPKHSHYFVRISRFMPRVEIVQKHNTAARRLYIRGHNGKIYPYLIVNDSGLGDARREERVLQLLRMLNLYFSKQKETGKRLLQITVPRVVAVIPQMRLVEDNPSSISLLDIYKSTCLSREIDHDAPITRYYDKLASVQARGMQASLQNLKEILKDVQTTMIPRTLLREWAVNTYPSPTDYWTFRKMFTLQLSLACFCEYVLHLTRLNPDMMYIHQDSGLLNVSYFKFDVDDVKGELDANRPVPFRLTPNIQELLTDTGIVGPLTASMIAAARCLIYPNFKVTSILKAILHDEIFAHRRKQEDQQDSAMTPSVSVAREQIIQMVTNAVNSISQRLNSLANFDDTESKVTTLVTAAKNPDNLCRMDPAWHPWL